MATATIFFVIARSHRRRGNPIRGSAVDCWLSSGYPVTNKILASVHNERTMPYRVKLALASLASLITVWTFKYAINPTAFERTPFWLVSFIFFLATMTLFNNTTSLVTNRPDRWHAWVNNSFKHQKPTVASKKAGYAADIILFLGTFSILIFQDF
ncbi:hypothetical protein [Sphingomonas montanisoli]|uniref:Uncharacterized protein n=1 Tax=Sphingomonas montanisoli TaxID=2606412 RepID=A0A5D9CBW7_9SPHN|nr:hypothetical protein [Sphingomonas montanisoli]TZG28876.1 hypothetical protein FYJ91_01660 [Sphingomonas montanisoli]